SSIAMRTLPRAASDRRGVSQRVSGACLGRSAEPHVAEFDLHAFDVEPHQRAVGEGENNHASRRIGLFECYGEQVERGVLWMGQAEMRNLQDPIEAQHARD